MNSISFTCLWPSPHLSSNTRSHWRVKAKATKHARQDAAWTAKAAHIARIKGAPAYDVECTFSPPDKRKRDRQNFPHHIKAHIDGISDALGCDDYCFNVTYVYRDPGLGTVGFKVTAATTNQ